MDYNKQKTRFCEIPQDSERFSKEEFLRFEKLKVSYGVITLLNKWTTKKKSDLKKAAPVICPLPESLTV